VILLATLVKNVLKAPVDRFQCIGMHPSYPEVPLAFITPGAGLDTYKESREKLEQSWMKRIVDGLEQQNNITDYEAVDVEKRCEEARKAYRDIVVEIPNVLERG
jgi:hypothetical protein